MGESNESITRTLMKKGEKGTRPWALGCQHCPLTLAEGPCSGVQCKFEKEMGNTLECNWHRPCLEIRSKVSVMSPIIRHCAGGVRSESETGEHSRRRPRSLSSSSSCSASPSQAQLECTLSAPRVPRCCVRPSSPPDSTKANIHGFNGRSGCPRLQTCTAACKKSCNPLMSNGSVSSGIWSKGRDSTS